MKKRIKLSLLLVALLLLLSVTFTACQSGGMQAPNDAVGDAVEKDDVGGLLTTGDVLSADRKIIKTVYETVETKEYDVFIEKLKTAVADANGYFSSSRYSGDGYEERGNRNAYFEIRIPADGLSAFTKAVGEMGSVSYYTESADDVTAAYVDVESRISVLSAEEAALLEILSKSGSVTEMLEIRKQLSDVQAELASLEAQKKSYDSLVAYSTVNLTLNEVDREVKSNDTFFGEVGEQFSDSLYGIGRFFRGFAVFFLGNSPILILLCGVGVGVFFLVRAMSRRSKKKTAEWEATHKAPENEEKK